MKLLTNNEAAERLGIGSRTLEQWRYLAKGPACVRFGRTIRYRESDVEEYINEHVEAA